MQSSLQKTRKVVLLFILLVPQYCLSQSQTLDRSDRQAVTDFYRNYYCSTLNVDAEWSGNVVGGNAGQVSDAYQAATLGAINFYRAMAGVSADITFNETYSDKSLQAALMFAANGDVTRYPSESMQFYTADAAEAAADSNFVYGYAGARAIEYYVKSSSYFHDKVPYRMEVLCPEITQMGSGDIVPADGSSPVNVLYVDDENPRTSGDPAAVAWPAEGYFPSSIIPTERWSFSYPDADFSQATVQVSTAEQSLEITQMDMSADVCLSTLVFTFAHDQLGKSADITYSVSIGNVSVGNETLSFSYQVKQFDANPQPAESSLLLTGTINDGYIRLIPALQHASGCPIPTDNVTYTFEKLYNGYPDWWIFDSEVYGSYRCPVSDTKYRYRLNGTDIYSNIVDEDGADLGGGGINDSDSDDEFDDGGSASLPEPESTQEARGYLIEALSLAGILDPEDLDSDVSDLWNYITTVQYAKKTLAYPKKLKKLLKKGKRLSNRFYNQLKLKKRRKIKRRIERIIQKAIDQLSEEQ